MGKMILITTDNEVKELEYPDGKNSWRQLQEHIGNGCSLLEHVVPNRLYTKIGGGSVIKNNEPGSKVSMLVDEEFLYHCNNIVSDMNHIASYLYETDLHGCPILGNALIVGEKYEDLGISFCAISDEQFNLIFPRLKDCEKKLKEERENR